MCTVTFTVDPCDNLLPLVTVRMLQLPINCISWFRAVPVGNVCTYRKEFLDRVRVCVYVCVPSLNLVFVPRCRVTVIVHQRILRDVNHMETHM